MFLAISWVIGRALRYLAADVILPNIVMLSEMDDFSNYFSGQVLPALRNITLIAAGIAGVYYFTHFTTLGVALVSYLVDFFYQTAIAIATAISHAAVAVPVPAVATSAANMTSLILFAHPIALSVIASSLVLSVIAYVLWSRRKAPVPQVAEKPNVNKKSYLSVEDNKHSQISECQFAVYEGGREGKSTELRVKVYNRFWLHDENGVTLETRHGYGNPHEVKVEQSVFEKLEDVNLLEESKKTDDYLMTCTGKFKQGEWVALASPHANLTKDDLLEVHANVLEEHLNFSYDPDLQQYYCQYQGDATKEITLIYKLKKPSVRDHVFNPDVTADTENILTTPAENFLPKEFIASFKGKLKNDDRLTNKEYLETETHQQLKYLNEFLDTTQADAERIKNLYLFFKTFQSDRDITPSLAAKDDVSMLLEIILQCSGTARQQNYAFVLLCQLDGFDCRFMENGEQTCCAFRYLHADGTVQEKTVRFSSVAPTQESLLSHAPVVTLQPAPASNKEISREFAALKAYYKIFKKMTVPEALNSLDQIIDFNKSNPSPLLILQEGQDAFDVNLAIIKHLKEIEGVNIIENHLFINDAKDFEHYLSPGMIADGKRTKELNNGPLRKMLTNQDSNAVLVIDFSSLSDLQKVAYQSLFDTPPTITIGEEKPFELPEKLKVIALIKHDDSVGESLRSRLQPWVVQPAILTKSPEEKVQVEEKPTAVEIELDGSAAFQEEVFGEIVWDGTCVEVKTGPLLEAITQKHPVIIYNPPTQNKKYQRLVQGMKEGKILVNGKYISIPPEVTLEERKRETVYKAVEIICEDGKIVATEKKIYLTISHIHECYKIVNITEEGKPKTAQKGLLDQYEVGTHIFYMTGFIPLSHWQKLMRTISADPYKEKAFKFMLAPGASIEGIKENTYRPEESKESSTFTSNDPSYKAQLLVAQDSATQIIYINEKTTFNDLIGKIKPTPEGFSVEKSDVLNVFKKRYPVILCGKMSFSLYQQLLPLLSADPHIYFNGERIAVSANAFRVVMPPADMTLLSYHHDEFTFQNYFDAFKDQDSETQLDQIREFYNRVEQLPHRGPGRPEKPYLSFHRVETMLKALKNPSATHRNPVKCVFNGDYPPESADYAYLNVMGKMIFNPEDNRPAKMAKLENLLKLYSITSSRDVQKYAWLLLDCFSGAQIKEIMGDEGLKNITEIIDGDGSNEVKEVQGEDKLEKDNKGEFPSLSSAALERLSNHVFSVKSPLSACDNVADLESKTGLSEEKSHLTPRHEKQMNQLEFYLKNKEFPIIILQGPTGVGKSHAVRQLLEGRYYEGEKDIIKWLESDGSIPFLADEMNMTDSYHFLEGLGRRDKTVVYKGEPYQLTNHQVIGTCNPVGPQYPNRFYLQVVQNLAVTINFKTPTEDFYKEVMLEKLKEILLSDKERTLVTDNVMIAFYLIQQYTPHLNRSIRDVENIAARFIYFFNKEQHSMNEMDLKELLFKTCMREFAGGIHTSLERQDFTTTLREKLELPAVQQDEKKQASLRQLTEKISIPESAAYFVDAIEEQLEIRWYMMLKNAIAKHRLEKENKESESQVLQTAVSLPYFKQSTIIEGASGVGKSTYLRAIVDKHDAFLTSRQAVLNQQSSLTEEEEVELTLLAREIKKERFKISGGSANGQLIKAFHSDDILIEDESNLTPEDALLGQFLCGQDEKANTVSHPGFVHFGSQNSTLHEARKMTSKSKANRCNLIYLEKLTDADLELFCIAKELKFSKQFMVAYNRILKECPFANVRTFHKVLDKAVEWQVQNTANQQLLRVTTVPAAFYSQSSSSVPTALTPTNIPCKPIENYPN